MEVGIHMALTGEVTRTTSSERSAHDTYVHRLFAEQFKTAPLEKPPGCNLARQAFQRVLMIASHMDEGVSGT